MEERKACVEENKLFRGKVVRLLFLILGFISFGLGTLGILDFIEDSPQGFDTLVCDKQGNLSTSQKRRLGLACVFLRGATLDMPLGKRDEEAIARHGLVAFELRPISLEEIKQRKETAA